MMRTGLLWAIVMTAALSATWAAEPAKADPGRLTGTWVCKSLDTDGQTVVTSTLTFADGVMTWTHPEVSGRIKAGQEVPVEFAFSVSKDGRLFGVVVKPGSAYGPREGDPFSASINLATDELTIREVKPTEGAIPSHLKGVYRKKP